MLTRKLPDRKEVDRRFLSCWFEPLHPYKQIVATKKAYIKVAHPIWHRSRGSKIRFRRPIINLPSGLANPFVPVSMENAAIVLTTKKSNGYIQTTIVNDSKQFSPPN